MMRNDIKLSICIPLYNGGNRVIKNIKRILTSSNTEFEIIVNDNCSDDNVIENLRTIKDERLKIFCNSKNVGPIRNSICALRRGSGEYLMLLLDRDILQIDYLNRYIHFIIDSKSPVILNLPFVSEKCDGKLNDPSAIYWEFFCPHPSFFVYRRNEFEKINISEDILSNGYYPALIAYLCGKDNIIYLNSKIPIVFEAAREYIALNPSRTGMFIGKDKKDDFEFEHYFVRFNRYLKFFQDNNAIDMKVIEILWRITLDGGVRGYYTISTDTINRHRYAVCNPNMDLQQYSRLYFLGFRYGLDVLKERGLYRKAIIHKMRLMTIAFWLRFENDFFVQSNISRLIKEFIVKRLVSHCKLMRFDF